MTRSLLTLAGLAVATAAPAADPPDSPRPVPLTRPEMKQRLEEIKARTPRIPLPPLTDAEKEKLGERGASYENRLRTLYLPWQDGRSSFGGGPVAAGGGRGEDPAATLEYQFKTQLFWIVSRANNCQYCLGHQESKLLAAGMTEDEIAALDGDWAGLPAARRAAYAFARRYTFEPHKLSDADITALREHFSPAQILEMCLSMAGNNQINRWKEGVGVPQSANGGAFGRRGAAEAPAQPAQPHTYLTPTSEAYREKVTKVAPTAGERPPLESRSETEKALAAARVRTPRLPLAAGTGPQWERLLEPAGNAGKGRVATEQAAWAKGDLSPLLKAQVAWIVARQDRAWYAAGLAKKRLADLGQTDDQVYALDGDWAGFAEAERALFTVARKLAASPVVLTDADVARAVKLAGPRDVVQLVSFTTTRAAFDRITEAAGLAIDP
jgi:alkylhydroperoxidase family enzyme